MVAKISFGSSLYGALAYPLRKVDASQGDVKKQVANTVKSLCATYKFQSLGEYRALLSLYNISLEEVRGEVGGREYHGFVYSATDDQGNKVGNPFKAKGIDVVFRHTADGRIYGATFIDHRTKCAFNGSRLGKNLSANALQEHFALPYENEQPIWMNIPKEGGNTQETESQTSSLFDEYGSGVGLMAGGGSSSEAQEAAFDRELRRKKKKRRGPKL